MEAKKLKIIFTKVNKMKANKNSVNQTDID